jgi:hypothetical protein
VDRHVAWLSDYNTVSKVRKALFFMDIPFILRSSRFCDVTQRRLVVTDVSGQPIGPILKGQAVQEDDCCLLRIYRLLC